MTENKIPIILDGNSFKYEVEAVCKLFFNTARFDFSDNIENANGENYIIASVFLDNGLFVSAQIRLGGDEPEKAVKSLPIDSEKSVVEHELCRLIFYILRRKTGIIPPWGLMTGIRPVKKVVALLREHLPEDEIKKELSQKYELAPEKFNLAYMTATNQLPLLNRINKRAVSLYVSIPFCPTRCSYCSFVSHSMDSAIKLMPEYVEALCREIRLTAEIVHETGTPIDTIYFGGGTPTSLPAPMIEKIMSAVAENFDLNTVREYCVEAGRPDTITEDRLRVIKNFGADRISVNPQTLNDSVLEKIGRNHTAADFLRAFELARKIGFNNINTDLIAGLPSESPESFRNSLDRIITLDPESITVHTLTVKRSADLFSSPVDFLRPVREMTEYSAERLVPIGYLPYYLYRQKNTLGNLENVGYSKKGAECLYNIFIMDETQTILGVGCAASTKLVSPDGKIRRIHNYKFPFEYIKRFDELMKKKQEVSECLKKISSVQ